MNLLENYQDDKKFNSLQKYIEIIEESIVTVLETKL